MDTPTPPIFRDREHAGRELAERLLSHRHESPLVLGLPGGGVPVAYEVARSLGAPLDVWVARKIGAPRQPELGMGAVAEGGEVFIDPHIVREVGADDADVRAAVRKKTAEVEERRLRLRRGQPAPEVTRKTVIVVDDGIATGGTVRAALRAIRRMGPRRLVLAVPVGAADTIAALEHEADEVVCLAAQPELFAIGFWYEDFRPVEDDEVLELLDRARARDEVPPAVERAVLVEAGGATLRGDLDVPEGASGVVLFAHGSGSSRKSPRNRFVAGALRRVGLASLLFDLLTEDEEAADAADAHLRFDVELLARRLVAATDWIRGRPEARRLRVGYFGASTGAAAAMIAAVERADVVGAVVSRGGRPDLAADWLERVRAPTLLVVGGDDREVLRLNRMALPRLAGPKRLSVVPRATHLFEEPGALDQVARAAADWFRHYLGRATIHAPLPSASPPR